MTDKKKTVVGVAKTPAEPAHSPLGPSSGKRWINCTGSVDFTRDMPDTTSIYAAEGTAAHTLNEMAQESGKPPRAFQGEVISTDGFDIEIDGEMAVNVQKFIEYVQVLPGDAYCEERVKYDAWVPNGWGTADDIRIDEDSGTCYVTDLKYGKGVPVFLAEDPQLKLYALGAFQEYGHLYDIKRFVLTIHQPRLDHIDKQEISVKDLLIWARDEVTPRADEALSGKGTFKAGSWCQFCPGKQVCETRNKTVQEEYLADFETQPEEVPNYKLAEIIDKLAEIRSWCNDMEARGLSELQKGNPVGDRKLVEGRSNRCWKNDDEAEKALRKVNKLKVADIFTRKLITAPAAEKLLGKDHEIMKTQVKKPPGKPVMVAGSDPRPPLQIRAEDEFEDLDNANDGGA